MKSKQNLRLLSPQKRAKIVNKLSNSFIKPKGKKKQRKFMMKSINNLISHRRLVYNKSTGNHF